MKNYVVGILSLFDNDLKLFRVDALNEFEAVKKAMLEFCDNDEGKEYEKEYQESEDYPDTIEGLEKAYEEIPFSVIEI